MASAVHLTNLPPAIGVTPGTQQRFVMIIRNTSAIVDQFTLSLSGIPDDWYTLEPSSVTLFPDATDQVALSIHPPAGTMAAAGAYPIEIAVASTSTPGDGATLSSTVTVATVGQLGMEVRPSLAQGRSAAFSVIWQNRTNAPVTVELEARDTEEGLRYRIDPVGDVDVAAGGEQVVEVAVRPVHRETIGEPHPYQITFRGLRAGTPDLLESGLSRPAQYTYVPPLRALGLPPWLRRLPMWVLMLLLLLAFLLVFLAGNRAGPHILAAPLPAATAKPSPPALPRVGKLAIQNGPGGATLVWAVDGARAVRIDGAVVAPRGSEAVSRLPAGRVVLEAAGDSGSTVRLLRLPAPIARTLPTSSPTLPAIIRFTLRTDAHTGTHTLLWQTRGAGSVMLDGVAVAPNGQRPIAASAGRQQFVLRARNALGDTRAVLALPAPDPRAQLVVRLPVIVQFVLAHPHPGQPYRVVWSTRDAGTVTLNGRHVAASGSIPLPSPLHSARYILVVANAEGRLTGRISVHVQ